jgi:hypothetical protein
MYHQQAITSKLVNLRPKLKELFLSVVAKNFCVIIIIESSAVDSSRADVTIHNKTHTCNASYLQSVLKLKQHFSALHLASHQISLSVNICQEYIIEKPKLLIHFSYS